MATVKHAVKMFRTMNKTYTLRYPWMIYVCRCILRYNNSKQLIYRFDWRILFVLYFQTFDLLTIKILAQVYLIRSNPFEMTTEENII